MLADSSRPGSGRPCPISTTPSTPTTGRGLSGSAAAIRVSSSGWARPSRSCATATCSSCVGFCAGGRFGLRAASRFGTDVAAAALLHPSRLVTDEPDSPHRQLDAATARLYLGFGENDHVTPVSLIPPLREQLESHHVPFRIEVIPNADHGFTMPGMPAYNREAAEQAWAGTLELLASPR
jgi:dienelactone hydrolase